MRTPFKMRDNPFKRNFDFGKTIDYSQEAIEKRKKTRKNYPKGYTETDIKFLKEQNEDIVREEDKK
tara:strand:+ start:238 stop:435 length:198 start_codon:yes stop_codon:yes gene_type:complete